MKSRLLISALALIFAMTLLLSTKACIAVSTTIRISQIYGGGGNTGAIYQNDFVELFNASSSPVSIDGWSMQYAPVASASWSATNLSGTLAAGGYYLIQLYSGGAVGTILPTPDIVGTVNMSATSGKVALLSSIIALSIDCPSGGSIIDFVGYGTSADCYEGSGATPAPGNTKSVIRASNGCIDTDNNSLDFATGTPAPRNSSYASNLCSATGIVEATDDSAINFWSSSNKLYIDFTKMEAVNATIEVSNILGQLLSEEKHSHNNLYSKEIDHIKSSYIIVKVIIEDHVIIKRMCLQK